MFRSCYGYNSNPLPAQSWVTTTTRSGQCACLFIDHPQNKPEEKNGKSEIRTFLQPSVHSIIQPFDNLGKEEKLEHRVSVTFRNAVTQDCLTSNIRQFKSAPGNGKYQLKLIIWSMKGCTCTSSPEKFNILHLKLKPHLMRWNKMCNLLQRYSAI